jgi:uncharacterized protein YidB (DUF937 family)
MDVSSLTSTSATTQVQRPHGPHKGGGPEKTMQAVAEKLGMDPDALKKALDGGETMSGLAAQAGITQDDLISTIAATLPTQGPDGVAIDTTSMATAIANGSRPERPEKPGVDLAQGIEALSSALGISGADLLDRLSSGTGVSDLLAQNPGVSSQLAEIQNKGALVDGYV